MGKIVLKLKLNVRACIQRIPGRGDVAGVLGGVGPRNQVQPIH